MADNINQVIHESTEALHLNRFSVTPVNDKWVITERVTPKDFQYRTNRDTQQDAINEVLRMLNYGDGVDASHQPHPAVDLLQRIMAANLSTELRGLLDEARKLCGPEN